MKIEFRNEAEFQAAILRAARTQGVLGYHTHDSRRSEPGFPDLVLLGRGGVMYRELKTDEGKLSPEQIVWLKNLRLLGEDADVWRPREWPEPIMGQLRALGPAAITLAAQAPTQEQVRAHLQQGRELAPPVDPRSANPLGNAR